MLYFLVPGPDYGDGGIVDVIRPAGEFFLSGAQRARDEKINVARNQYCGNFLFQRSAPTSRPATVTAALLDHLEGQSA